jgi:hypothetical protein
MRVPIHPGAVDWAGENPGIYLREAADGPFVTLMVFFRIVVSRFGRGHVLALLERPLEAVHWPDAANLLISDNEPLARYLIGNFVAKFPAFADAVALEGLPHTPLTGVTSGGDGLSAFTETVRAEGLDVELTWQDLGTPFAVELASDRTPTGHEMFSTFVEGHDASITVNGRRLAGKPFPRDFNGRTTSSAFLALCESWVTPSP